MGEYMGWRCADCGAGEGFRSGGGMLSFNDPELVDRAKAGELGPAMQVLLAEGIPQGWTLFNESAFYPCPGCGGVIAGGVVRIDDGSGNWLVFHAAPDACGECGYELLHWDERVPMGESELASRCAERVEAGCPECGGKNVVLESMDWD